MRIEHVEAIVEDYYASIGLSADRSAALREYIHAGLSARRAELERRQQQTLLTQLDHERRKLLELHYRDAIAPNNETTGPASTSQPTPGMSRV